MGGIGAVIFGWAFVKYFMAPAFTKDLLFSLCGLAYFTALTVLVHTIKPGRYYKPLQWLFLALGAAPFILAAIILYLYAGGAH